MLTKKTAAVMVSLALASSMVVPGFAADAIPAQRTEMVRRGEPATVISSPRRPALRSRLLR